MGYCKYCTNNKNKKNTITQLQNKIKNQKQQINNQNKNKKKFAIVPSSNAGVTTVLRPVRNPVDYFCKIWVEAFKDPFAKSSSGLCPGYLAAEGFEPFLYKATFQIQNNANVGFLHLFPNPVILASLAGCTIPLSSNFGCENIVLTNGNLCTNFAVGTAAGTTGLSSAGKSYVVLNVGYRLRSVQSVNSTSAMYRGARVSVRAQQGFSSDVFKASNTTYSIGANQISIFLCGYDPAAIDTESLPGTLPRFTNYDIMEKARQFSFRPITPQAFDVKQTNDGSCDSTLVTSEGTSNSFSVVDIINTGLNGTYSTQTNGPTSCAGWDTIIHQIYAPTGTALAEIEMIFHLAVQPAAPNVAIGSGNYHPPVPSAVILDDSRSVNPGLLHQWASRAIDLAGKTVDFVSRNRAAQNMMSRFMIANGYV